MRFETTSTGTRSTGCFAPSSSPRTTADTAKCEIQFGHIERPTTERDSVEKAQFEVCAHKWIATKDDAGGFALLNDSKYGHRAKNGMISLNLLRAPTSPTRPPTAATTTSPTLHARSRSATSPPSIREGYRLNNPLLVGDDARCPSFVSRRRARRDRRDSQARRERGRHRAELYESLGRRTTARLTSTSRTLRESRPT